MFGGYDDPASYEGYVAADGAFELTSSLRGERTIFVVGRDKQPVKAFGVDVIAGGKNNAGAVDLSGSCPK
jgi:hypothetical protein